MVMRQIVANIAERAPDVLVSDIERASAQHTRIFWWSIGVIVFAAVATAIATAVVTYLVWKSGNRVQDAIRAEATAKIADANLKIAEANLQIATAQESAAAANKVAAQAGEGTAKALEDVATANERAGKLELEVAQQRAAAEQRERAAKAERELVELRQRISPRRLSKDQLALINVALQKVPPVTVRIMTIGDAEARGFAEEITRALNDSGWRAHLELSAGIMSPPPYGIRYFTGDTPQMSASVQAMVDAMRAGGIDVHVVAGSFDGPGLLVGLKPVVR